MMPGEESGVRTMIEEYKKREERNLVLSILSIIAGGLSVVLHPWIFFTMFEGTVKIGSPTGLGLMMIPFACAVAAFALATVAFDTHKVLAAIGGVMGGLVFLSLLVTAIYVMFFVFI